MATPAERTKSVAEGGGGRSRKGMEDGRNRRRRRPWPPRFPPFLHVYTRSCKLYMSDYTGTSSNSDWTIRLIILPHGVRGARRSALSHSYFSHWTGTAGGSRTLKL